MMNDYITNQERLRPKPPKSDDHHSITLTNPITDYE